MHLPFRNNKLRAASFPSLEGTAIEQSLYDRGKHRYGENRVYELSVESVYVKRWEGPSYREPPTAIVKAPEPGPQGLRPNFGLRI